MLISPVELMRLFEATIGRDGAAQPDVDLDRWKSDSRESYFDDQSADQVQNLQQILSGQPNFLLALAETYEVRGKQLRSKAIREIERFLAQNADDMESSVIGVRRLTGLVYPVV